MIERSARCSIDFRGLGGFCCEIDMSILIWDGGEGLGAEVRRRRRRPACSACCAISQGVGGGGRAFNRYYVHQ